MKELLALTLLFSLGSAQFVFFGGRFGQGLSIEAAVMMERPFLLAQ